LKKNSEGWKGNENKMKNDCKRKVNGRWQGVIGSDRDENEKELLWRDLRSYNRTMQNDGRVTGNNGETKRNNGSWKGIIDSGWKSKEDNRKQKE
jgi:hypothetical protein